MLMMGGLIMIIGAAIPGSSYIIAQLITGRIVTNIGNSMDSSTAPVYQSECSPARIRGALFTLRGTVTILGWIRYPSILDGPIWKASSAHDLLCRTLILLHHGSNPAISGNYWTSIWCHCFYFLVPAILRYRVAAGRLPPFLRFPTLRIATVKLNKVIGALVLPK